MIIYKSGTVPPVLVSIELWLTLRPFKPEWAVYPNVAKALGGGT
jgi:hypothetical protein